MTLPRGSRAALRCTLGLLLWTSSLRAQTGVLDQASPTPGAGQTANFAVSNPAQVWQQQVRAGVAGTLVGVKLQLSGPATAQVTMRVRNAPGWTTAAPAFQTLLHKTAAGAQNVYVDTSGAGLTLAVGQRFVIELVGNNTFGGVNGSYTPTSQGAPQYAEPLFLGGPGCYSNCGWRIGFETYVRDGDVTEFCFGATCPCGNVDPAGGCANSTGQGAKLARASGSTSVAVDDLALSVNALPPNVSTLLFVGPTQARIPFGDGVRCAGGFPRRMQLIASDPTGSALFQNPVARTNGLISAGSVWHFQVWYRDALGPCHSGIGLSSALQVVFAP